MSTDAQEWITKATELREEGRVEESIIAARKATSIEPDSANAWWQLALSVSRKNGDAAALEHLLKTVELAPHFAFGWHRVGVAYSKAGLIDEAEEAWKTAVNEDSERTDSLRALLQLYKKREAEGDKEQILTILEQLEAQNSLTNPDVHTLAIAYHNKGEYLNAIPLYKRYIAEQDDEYGYFNIGLAYSQPTISQDVDAVDAWRQSLRVNPEYDRPKTSIASVLPKLLALKNRVLASTSAAQLIPPDQWFVHYLNPYELLNFTDLESSFDLETKEIQRAKNGLIHEIQLEDGVVSWMPGLTIDRSRLIQVTDELHDEEKKEWHSSTNKPIGTLSITGDKLTRDLIRGTDVDLTIEMSESRDLTVSAYLNGTGQEFSQVFAPKQRDVSSQMLASEILLLETKLQSEIDDANKAGSRDTADNLGKVLDGVQELIGQAADLADDDVTDKKFQLEDKKRKLAQDMYELTSGKRLTQMKAKYAEVKADVQVIVRESGNDRERHLVSEIIAREQAFINSSSPEKIKEATEELESIRWQILLRTPDFLKGMFKYLMEKRASMNDQIQATQLFENGKRAIERDDFDGLNQINSRLWDLMPTKEKDSEEYRAFTGIV